VSAAAEELIAAIGPGDAGADLANGRPFPLGDGGIAKPAGGGERQRIKTTVMPAAGFLRARARIGDARAPNF
jgi:hypothetical protein